MDCNILLLGQTGVGKSTLLNYLAGEDLAAAGISTGIGGLTHGIHKYPIVINGQNCIVSDSEGFETTHSDFWEKLIEKELFNNKSKRLKDWYHIVVYCIGANGGRVQDFELSILDRIIDSGYGVIIAFTKSDLATDDEIDSMIDAITEHIDNTRQLSFVPICSRKTRNSVPEGKELLCEGIIDSWGESLINRLPEHIYGSVSSSLCEWYNSVFDWLSEQKIGLFNWSKEDLLEELNNKFKKKQDSINSGIRKRQNAAFNEISTVYGTLSQVLDIASLSSLSKTVAPKIEKLESAFVFDNHTGRNSAVIGAAAFGMITMPVLAVPMVLGGAILSLIGRNKRSEELIDAFNYQYTMLSKAYFEKKNFLECSLAAELGYIYGYRELAIYYLKGRGVEENFSSFCENMTTLESILEDNQNDFYDGRSEYYIAYMYFALNDISLGKEWIKRSYKHDYQDAKKVYKFSNIYSEMKELEEKNDLEYLRSWF